MKKKMNGLLAAIMSIQVASGLTAPVLANEYEEPAETAENEVNSDYTSEINTEVINNETVNAASGPVYNANVNYIYNGEIIKSTTVIFSEAGQDHSNSLRKTSLISSTELSSQLEWGLPDGYTLGPEGFYLYWGESDEEYIQLQLYKQDPTIDQLRNQEFVLLIERDYQRDDSYPFLWKDVDADQNGFISLEEVKHSVAFKSSEIDLNHLVDDEISDPEHLMTLSGGRVQTVNLTPNFHSENNQRYLSIERTLAFFDGFGDSFENVSFTWVEADEDGDLTALSAEDLKKYVPEGFALPDNMEPIEFYSEKENTSFSQLLYPVNRKEELMDQNFDLLIIDQEAPNTEDFSYLVDQSFVWRNLDINQDTYLDARELEYYLPKDYVLLKPQTSADGKIYFANLFEVGQEITLQAINQQASIPVELSFVDENGETIKTEQILWKDYDPYTCGILYAENLKPLLPDGYKYRKTGALLRKTDGNSQTVLISKDQTEKIRPVDQFADIPEDHWGREVINEAVEKGIMVGLDDEHFGPSEPMSRAMAVTVLWRLAGTPETAYKNSFTDIQDDLWYTKAVNWAVENNVVHGMTDTTFEPDTNINREQLAVMITNYLHSRGMSLETDQGLDQFKDKDEVSSFAETSMKFVVKHGIMSGAENGTMLMPKKDTERAEAAKMFLLASKL